MKALIWIVCFLVATILNTLLGYATGFKVGWLLFYLGISFVAKKLCNKWDDHKEEKVRQKKLSQYVKRSVVEKDSSLDYPSDTTISTVSGWECSCGRVHPKYETSCVCGKTKLDSKNSHDYDETVPNADKICFCRKCGEKLIDNSRFCRKCGTEVVKE